MRRSELQCRKRTDLAWYGIGMLVVQGVLAVGATRLSLSENTMEQKKKKSPYPAKDRGWI